MFAAERRRHSPEMTVGERWDRHSGEEPAAVPGDESFLRQERGRCREEEGTAALCGDGETHQVGDRPRTDRGSPEPAHVRVLGRKPGRVLVPNNGFDGDTSSRGRPCGVDRMNGGARRWRGNPGTGGRTSTVSGNGSRRRRGCERHTQHISNNTKKRQEARIGPRNVLLNSRRPIRSARPTKSGRCRDHRSTLDGFQTPESSRRSPRRCDPHAESSTTDAQ